ncbi:type II toxin-antitoxin system RelE/ParE family toxin [bacterium]|nr:type II toxin-antitoxin system RelE/ParE family toxin [bacterium]
MIIRVLACAETELSEAVAYYNEQCPGLGFKFAAETKAALARIMDFPDAWPKFSGRSRRCLLDRFPYGVLYHKSPDEILVVAVMHLSRAPKRWADRLRETFGKKSARHPRRPD